MAWCSSDAALRALVTNAGCANRRRIGPLADDHDVINRCSSIHARDIGLLGHDDVDPSARLEEQLAHRPEAVGGRFLRARRVRRRAPQRGQALVDFGQQLGRRTLPELRFPFVQLDLQLRRARLIEEALPQHARLNEQVEPFERFVHLAVHSLERGAVFLQLGQPLDVPALSARVPPPVEAPFGDATPDRVVGQILGPRGEAVDVALDFRLQIPETAEPGGDLVERRHAVLDVAKVNIFAPRPPAVQRLLALIQQLASHLVKSHRLGRHGLLPADQGRFDGPQQVTAMERVHHKVTSFGRRPVAATARTPIS